jgi:hypothetical protein
MARKLYAQGDILLEEVENATPVEVMPHDRDGAIVLARGEITGHRHTFHSGNVVMFRDAALARDVPPQLYLGHIRIDATPAELQHEEHATVTLPAGTYRVRRQREWDVIGQPLLIWE